MMPLMELCTIKLLGNVEAMMELALRDVDEKIFEFLDKRSSVMMIPSTKIQSSRAKHALALYFSRYLTTDNINLLSKKK